MLRSQRGATLIEMAVMTPVLLMVLFSAIDIGLVGHRYIAACTAAEAAAAAAASAMVGRPLALPIVPPDAQDAARDAARRLEAIVGEAQTDVSWVGSVRVSQRELPPYEFVFEVPQVANRSQTVDWSHRHMLTYSEPVLSPRWGGTGNATWMSYPDRVSSQYWRWVSFPHAHSYADRTNSVAMGQHWGWAIYGIWMILPPGAGWGAGLVASTNAPAYGYSPYDRGGSSSWATPGAWSLNSSSPQDDWRSASTDWFWTPDLRTDPTDWPTESAPTSGAGGPVTVGPYTVRAGTTRVTVTAPRPPETVERRTLRAEVTVRLSAISPWMRPLLNGRRITRVGFANAERAR